MTVHQQMLKACLTDFHVDFSANLTFYSKMNPKEDIFKIEATAVLPQRKKTASVTSPNLRIP